MGRPKAGDTCVVAMVDRQETTCGLDPGAILRRPIVVDTMAGLQRLLDRDGPSTPLRCYEAECLDRVHPGGPGAFRVVRRLRLSRLDGREVDDVTAPGRDMVVAYLRGEVGALEGAGVGPRPARSVIREQRSIDGVMAMPA